MNWFLAIAAVAVLSATVVDLYATVVKPGGGGLLATRVASAIWRIGLVVHRQRPSHRLLSNIGVVAVVSVTLVWMLLMWLGWSMLYLSSDASVLDSASQLPADSWSRVYFAGYSLFTSGLGDKVPGGTLWQMATVLTSFMGLGLVTLAITFLVPILQAATERRSMARAITHLGETPAGIIERSWNGHHRLASVASDLATQTAAMTDRHLSYPVLEHLHSATSDTAFTPRLAALYDAAILAVDDASETEAADLEHLRVAIADHADLLCSRRPAGVRNEAPAVPGSAESRQIERFEDASQVRRRLDALVRYDGWTWDTVETPAHTAEDRKPSPGIEH